MNPRDVSAGTRCCFFAHFGKIKQMKPILGKLILLTLAVLAAVPAYSGPVAKGSRQIGIDILDTTPASSFGDNIAHARSVGANSLILTLGWNQIEAVTPADCTSPGSYIDPGGALNALNSLLPKNGLRLSLTVAPIATSMNLMPSNLASKPFDNFLVVCRYEKMLEFVFSKISGIDLISFQVGNEVDAYAAASFVDFWSQYWTFLSAEIPAAHRLRQGLKVSVVGTLYGATGHSANPLAKGGLAQLWKLSDMISVTYYPITAQFKVKSPSVVPTELASLLNLFPSKVVYLNEIGFPSGSSFTGSSALLQEQYIHQLFLAWDKFPVQLACVGFLRLNDLSSQAARDQAAHYGLSGNKAFVEYLQTLGMRTFSGADKPSFTQLKTETSLRHW